MATQKASTQFAETMKSNRLLRMTPVVKDGVIIKYVSNNFTSIGAAKVLGTKSAKLKNLDGIGYSWVPSE
jgi:hypothetical protein